LKKRQAGFYESSLAFTFLIMIDNHETFPEKLEAKLKTEVFQININN
jgi:hypothetical protein